jgi:hypothetical protein
MDSNHREMATQLAEIGREREGLNGDVWRLGDQIKDAADIIDLLKTVIETELVKLRLPTIATPTSALGRARSFIEQYGSSDPRTARKMGGEG